jgi:hypothetical protein
VEGVLVTDSAAVQFRPFSSLADALDGPRSAYFGVGSDGQGKRPESYYQRVDRYVSFDVSNNQILCSIAANGLLENACILRGLVPGPALFDNLPGVFAHKELIGGGPWPFSVQLEDDEQVDLHSLPGATADLLGNLFPRFTYQRGALLLRLLAFCPMTATAASAAPRAVIVALQVRNEGERAVQGVLRVASQVADLAQVEDGSDAAWHQAITCLDDTKWQPERPDVAFRLSAGETAVFAFGFLLGERGEELLRTGRLLRERNALQWLNDTWRHHSERLGQLSIPEAPYFAETLIRFRELCRQSVLRMADGRFGGGFWGSDFIGVSAWASPKIWNKDNFHAMLPMALLEPSLCRDAIPFFLRWALPQAAYGASVRRFPDPGRVTHSLANALSPLVLAGAYYQMTGDRAFFRGHAEILHGARDLLRAVLASQQGKPFLFPSLYLSDGESRGDYHTGSNLLVWYALHHMARIASEAYQDLVTAQQWAEAASKVKDAVRTYCVGESYLGRRFVEGADADGTWVTCHDGEETDVALMPFYGFCDSDDPALLNHSKLALSPLNPLYARGVDGIWWGDSHQPAATFPGWMTALAGAATEGEANSRLEQIGRLTDVDGSIWWWPYKSPETDPAKVRRRDPWFTHEVLGEKQEVGVGKCGWAAGVYLCLFVHNVLGIRVDVPARQVSLRPFCPWPEFTWTDCRLGDSRFDFAYERRGGRVMGRITNRNASAFSAVVELMLPEGAGVTACRCDGAAAGDVEHTQRYGRPAMRATRSLGPGETLSLQVDYGT